MLPVWKLIGFILYVILYYSVLDVYTVWPAESFKSVFFKVMPVMHLVFVVISTSMDDDVKVKSSRYRWNTVLGLITCGIGDCCMIFADCFNAGSIMFAIAHLFYIRAFGIYPMGSKPMAASFAVAAVAVYFFLIDMLPMSLFKVAGITYLLVIITMAWRSMVILHSEKSFGSFLACFGAILFMVSDILLTVDKFHESFSRAPFWVMLTYYGAQLGLALSACDTHSQYSIKKDY